MTLFKLCLAAAILGFAPLSGNATPDQGLVRRTDSGQVAGKSIEGVREFLGIPYAQAPVGPLRWREPQPMKSWSGTRSARTFGANCMQQMDGPRLPWTEEFMAHGAVSEDCLFLNVWTTAAPGDAQPVIVFIHGGSFLEGSGSVPVYDGSNLARRGVVFVTINYRLGPLGFLAHPELSRESPDGVSGNYGLLDQIAALRWVQRNIEQFGGDPKAVTIAGQSAGAMSVAALIGSPEGEGLFARAIVESGPGLIPTSLYIRAPEAAERDGERFAAALGAPHVRELRAVAADKLARWGPPGAPFVPRAFVADPKLVTASVQVHGVALMVGLVAGDPAVFFYPRPSNDLKGYRQFALSTFGERAEQFLRAYPAAGDEGVPAAFQTYITDRARANVEEWATQQSQKLAPIFTYYFDRAIPWPQHPEFGAFHTSEVPYAFGTLDRLPRPWDSDDHTLSDRMIQYWGNFARQGDPNGPSLPHWSPFTPGARVTLHLGSQVGDMNVVRPAAMGLLAAP